MQSKILKRISKTTSVSSKKIKTPGSVRIRPSGTLTPEEFDRVVIRRGRNLTAAERRKYAKFLKVRPMRGTLTAKEAEEIVIREGGRPLTAAERRKYTKFLK